MEKVAKVSWAAVGSARAQPHPVTAALNEALAVQLRAASPPPGLDPPAPSYQVRRGAGVETWQLEMVWGSLTMLQGMEERHVHFRLGLEHWCAPCCCKWYHCPNLRCNIFWGVVIVPSSQWQAERRHSGIQVTLWVLIRLLGALRTLTYWGFISWPVVFRSESGSGMICILTSRCFSDGEVVFVLYDQINLTRAKGKKQKNGIWNSPSRCLVEPSCNAFCFPSTRCSCKVENYKSKGGPKLDRND